MRMILIALIVVVLLVAGVFAREQFAAPDVLPVYQTATIERRDIVSTIGASGKLEAVVTVKVGSQLSGQIAELMADFNDEVHEGQVIARLDARTFEARVREARAGVEVAQAAVRIRQAEVEQAKAGVENARAGRAVVKAETTAAQAQHEVAKREFERNRSLQARGGVASVRAVEQSQASRDAAAADLQAARAREKVHATVITNQVAALRRAEAELENASGLVRQARAVLEEAEVDLARTEIRAPINGIVIGRNVDLGQTVAASLEAPTLFTLAQDLRQMEVHANVDEADIGRVENGQEVTFTVDAFPDRTFSGRVIQIRKAPQVTQNVVVFTVVISAENPDLVLLPGMTATVAILVLEIKDVLTVPNAALRFRPPSGAPVSRPGQAIAADSVNSANAALPGLTESVWALDDNGTPTELTIRAGTSDASATVLVEGPLSEGHQVIVGYSIPTRGLSGLSLQLGF